jgi:hypothetical protein
MWPYCGLKLASPGIKHNAISKKAGNVMLFAKRTNIGLLDAH